MCDPKMDANEQKASQLNLLHKDIKQLQRRQSEVEKDDDQDEAIDTVAHEEEELHQIQDKLHEANGTMHTEAAS